MSQITKDINKITGTIIGISGKLILYALVILLLAEGITRGYAFGHEIFYSTAMEEAPGTDKVLTVPQGQDVPESIRSLKDLGLISNELAIRIQMKFYDYEIYPGTYNLNTSMTSKEILQLLNQKPEETDAAGETEAVGSGETAGADRAAAGVQSQDEWPSDGAEELETEIQIPEGGTQE